MKNRFYSEFDTEPLPGAGPKRPEDYRTPFQVDRDRIIHSSAFRKLQSKTQVFQAGEYDFYRTRLTHSIEVAQIGRSICQYLRSQRDGPLSEDYYIDEDLVEAVCLAHDLGHPPFGHGGERKLHELMREAGGFEGNAQTLRLLTETLYVSEAREAGTFGMSPTRAFADGVMKYKTLLRERPDAANHFIYDEQASCRDFVFGGVPVLDEIQPGEGLNAFKSIECQIMDWADDTAYSLNDIIDGVRAGFLTFEKIESWAEGAGVDANDGRILELKKAIRGDRLEAVFGRKIGDCIRACRLVAWENPMASRTNRYAYRLEIEPAIRQEVDFFKRMAYDIIFMSPQLFQMEHKGRYILEALFRAFVDNYVESDMTASIRVLPRLTERIIAREGSRAGKLRRICDHIAGMTDGLARRTWKRLFDPDFASIVDLG